MSDKKFSWKDLRSMNREDITAPVIMRALDQDGQALQYVPEEMITPELCRYAVHKSGSALLFCPVEYVSYDLCVRA